MQAWDLQICSGNVQFSSFLVKEVLPLWHVPSSIMTVVLPLWCHQHPPLTSPTGSFQYWSLVVAVRAEWQRPPPPPTSPDFHLFQDRSTSQRGCYELRASTWWGLGEWGPSLRPGVKEGREARAVPAEGRPGFSALRTTWLEGSVFSTLAPPSLEVLLPVRDLCCVSLEIHSPMSD